MTPGSVTVVVVQRERLGTTRLSLESLLSRTEPDVPIWYVDAGSRGGLRRYLRRRARERGFRLWRFDHHLSPTEARALALAEVTTRYVVFTDNDVVFTPGWLPPLVRCAEETGADLVTPLLCIGQPVHSRVHVAGGETTVTGKGDRRSLREVQRFEGRPVEEVREHLLRGPTGLVEFHCMLARTDALRRAGGIDPRLLSTSEHLDVCLAVRAAGGTIFFEPESVVTYLPPPPLALRDAPFYALRWCDAWNQASEEYFHRKWGLAFDDHVVRFSRRHRRIALAGLRAAVTRVVGRKRGKRFSNRLDEVLVAIASRGRPADSPEQAARGAVRPAP